VYSYCPNREKGLASTSVHRVQKKPWSLTIVKLDRKTELDGWNISVHAKNEKNACSASLEKYAAINKQ
jgi:hypothetical protein